MSPRLGMAIAFASCLAAGALAATTAQAQQPAPPASDQGRPVQPEGQRLPPRSQADRAAFLDARIAAVHAGLQLTPDQEKLWPSLESAVRDGMNRIAQQREKARSDGPAADPIEALARNADSALNRGEALKKIADAARPLYATLTEDQKRRLPLLVNAGRNRFGDMRERLARSWQRFAPGQDDRRGPGDRRRGDRFGPPPGGDN